MELNKALDMFGLGEAKESPKSSLPIIEKSIGDKTVYVIDRLDKAKLFYNINDVIADFFVEKTGKEIKEQLKVIKSLDEAEAASYIVQANDWLKECGCKPTATDMIGDYELRGTKLKFGTVPNMFSWEETSAWDKQNEASMNQSYGNEKVAEKVENPYRKYNQCIRMYVECRVESLILDTVINNMDDKKKYKLTAEQASKLGF